MTSLKLIIANKKYSSWSLRPWLALKTKGIEFEEELSQFDHTTTPLNKHFWAFSPSKKVPVLIHNGQTIWDSLSILEYLAEVFPEAGLWPSQQSTRAHARSVANEMHSGFFALRAECPMNMARAPGAINISAECRADIARIETLFADCFERYNGEFLFGAFSIADAMFAPVVNRMRVYKLSEAPAVQRFCDAIEALPAWREWDEAGKAEPWHCDVVEI